MYCTFLRCIWTNTRKCSICACISVIVSRCCALTNSFILLVLWQEHLRNSWEWTCIKTRCMERALSIFISNFAVDRRKKMKVAFVTFVFLSIFGTCVSWTPMEKIQKKHLCSSCDTKEKALQFSYDVLSTTFLRALLYSM